MNSNVAVCIANYNDYDNALYLMEEFRKYFNYVFISDSGSEKLHWMFHKTDEPYAVGNFNKCMQLFLGTHANAVFSICADVKITPENVKSIAQKMIDMPDDVGTWTPVVNGRSHYWLQPVDRVGLREIPFCEGMIYYAKRSVIDSKSAVYPLTGMKHGAGHDVYIAYTSKKQGMKNLLDDTVEVYHPAGTRYDGAESTREMMEYIGRQEQGFKKYAADVLGVYVD